MRCGLPAISCWPGRRPSRSFARRPSGAGEDAHALRQRFTREAQATAELQSPHTVQLFDFGVTDTGSFYYVMERLRGMDLQRMVERHGPLPPERVIFLLKQACLSLSEAHALGLVHRDIKPANLFVCRLGSEYDFLKVLDFGVVSRQARESTAPITVTGMVLGTPAFLAPELVSGQGSFDGRADIYALGCVAFWLLTGRPPFEADDAMSLLMHHSQHDAASAFGDVRGVHPRRRGRARSRVPVEGRRPAGLPAPTSFWNGSASCRSPTGGSRDARACGGSCTTPN